MNKKVISYLLIITIILNLFCLTIASQAINVKDYRIAISRKVKLILLKAAFVFD